MPNFTMALISAVWGGLIASPSDQNYLTFAPAFNEASKELMGDRELCARLEQEFFLEGFAYDEKSHTFTFKRQQYWHRKVTEVSQSVNYHKEPRKKKAA